MPIYEYRCERCGAQFEELTLTSSGTEPVACRACDSRRVTRLLSAFAVSHAGSDGAAPEPGPCGACGAPRRGMCGEG
jgi:putative FmdB family regulatory protein